tara:strand:- start:193 stop:543 length:351 start_codon:yes stop_codon:yes gene_type:complete
MILVDGIEYQLYKPKNEGELESYIEENSKQLFGEDSLYFSIKTKLRGLGGVGSIPDAYAIILSKPYKWYLIETELSSHSIFNHIVPQLHKFIQGIKDPTSRKNIVEALHNEIKSDP